MDYSFEIYKIKTGDYLDRINDALSHHIHNGLSRIYDLAVDTANGNEMRVDTLIIFQEFLRDILNWSDEVVSVETKKILGYNRGLENLVKATLKADLATVVYPLSCEKHL